jgi:hypothetical protein
MGALGGALLLWALFGFLRVTLSARAPGDTAGGAATIEERCSRSVPADQAKACIQAGRQQAVAATLPLELAAMVGVALIALAIGSSRSARRRAKK